MAAVKRPHKFTLRTERARVTRHRIVEAARHLFAARGYGATTLEAIAAEAGVAVQTVYAVYRSKAGILRALLESVVHQPEADSQYEEAMHEPVAHRKLELFARAIRMRWERGYDVVATLEDAGRTEPRVLKEVERALATRRAGLERLARSLEGVDHAHAAALLDSLSLPALYRQLVAVHLWTPDEYEAWLSASLRQQLLGARREGLLMHRPPKSARALGRGRPTR